MKKARLTVAMLLVGGMVAAFVALAVVGRGGAISGPGNVIVIRYVLEFFFPLIGVAGAFYLAERGITRGAGVAVSSPEAIVFALGIVALWVSIPTLCLGLSGTYETAIAYVDTFKLYGTTLATSAVTFVFARSARHQA